MGKKAKVKAPKGFVEFTGRQADFLPSLKPKLAQVMRDALLRTAGIDFGEVEILNTVEAPMNGGVFLFVEMQQVGTSDPITFSIPAQQIIQALGNGAYLRGDVRSVRHYRAAKKYKILPSERPVDHEQLRKARKYFVDGNDSALTAAHQARLAVAVDASAKPVDQPKAGDVVVDKESDQLSVVKADGTVEAFQ